MHRCMGEICGHILQLIVNIENEYDKDPSLFLRVEVISLILLESRDNKKTPKNYMETEDSSPSSLVI